MNSFIIRFLLFFLLLSGCLLINACTPYSRSEEENNRTGNNELQDSSVKSDYITTNKGRETINSDVGYCWTVDNSDSLINSGTVEYTLQRVYVCHSLEELPNSEEGCFEPFEAYFLNYEDDVAKPIRYPDFVMNDGSFIGNGQIIVCEIKVRNINAVPCAVGGGTYAEEYLFRADNIMFLVDTSEESQGLAEGRECLPFYFAQGSAFPEHMMLFKVLPGETVDISIGFLISGTKDGNTQDLSVYKGNVLQKARTISLNLGL